VEKCATTTINRDLQPNTPERLAHCREWGRHDYHAGKPPRIPPFLKKPEERRAYAVGYTADKPFVKESC
jgi:hypothetical protein